MAEEAHNSPAPDADAKEAAEPTAALEDDIESRITTAMRSRVSHFQEQANSLTFEGVRRLLEKDLGLETFALDVHKRFVKQCLLKYLDAANNDDTSKSPGETVEKNVSLTTEVTDSPKGRQSKKDLKEACSEDEEKLEDSPVLGLLTGSKTTKKETTETDKEENKVSESIIKKAIRKRASYIVANSEKVTLASLRRLLEEDLKLDKFTLDPYKKFISGQLDEVLKSCEVSAPASDVKKKNLKKQAQSNASKNSSKKMSSASSGSEGDEDEEEEDVKPKRKIISKGKIKNSERARKIPKTEAGMPRKKTSRRAESISDDNSDSEESGSASDDGRSRSSAAKAVKRKETPTPPTPVYGKHVEHLKSVIKSCGMSIPPSIYKRVKQVPENKREGQLIKELEDILSKEGLSSNPSEKEIKEVRKKKERAKELEGIDTSNIVSSSRRRSTTSFVAPPKPKIPDLSDDESEESDEDNDEDDGDDEDNEDEDGGEGNSQSEESDEGLVIFDTSTV
ncbi:hypothetical protein CCACVL1_22694 [Corchorus capsularis]|uniref:DEK-C domain-containing protein n=1 Tax=Corchorus capsularis TaxID=210143 RepID=A0A1R3GXC6_COCAP|nr:hypothetical protein CCACVL1_22694 [Corchorus capsularis]